MVNRTEQDDAGINVGQIVRDKASNTASKARKLFSGKVVKNIVDTLKEKGDYENCSADTVSKMSKDPQKLKLAMVQIYGTSILAFFDSGKSRR